MRKIININKNWIFKKKEQGVEDRITLPYTWNAIDGQDGGNDYYRGCCIFERKLTAEELQDIVHDKRIYLEINGAAMTAEVFLNGKKICRHEGGYSTFRVDMTEYIVKNAMGSPVEGNVLRIRVDNEDNDYVYPQKADFTFYGGLYRDVNLIIVPNTHFALDYYGTPGIRITPEVNLQKKSAVVSIETYVSGEEMANVCFMVDGKKQTVSVK